mmetsp:Transcript_5096/g.13426  ORF Transcript_5096/g.13426 Transcript_5096/m.13426 type:complete len:213 (-) Transcript_5096:172-810(-)
MRFKPRRTRRPSPFARPRPPRRRCRRHRHSAPISWAPRHPRLRHRLRSSRPRGRLRFTEESWSRARTLKRRRRRRRRRMRQRWQVRRATGRASARQKRSVAHRLHRARRRRRLRRTPAQWGEGRPPMPATRWGTVGRRLRTRRGEPSRREARSSRRGRVSRSRACRALRSSHLCRALRSVRRPSLSSRAAPRSGWRSCSRVRRGACHAACRP